MGEPVLNVSLDVVGMDFDKLERAFVETIEEGMDKLKDRIEEVWREKAEGLLDTSKKKYLEGLSVERVGKDSIQCSLSGFLPVAIEEGQERYDMKPGLLKGVMSKVIPIGKAANQKINFVTMNSASKGWWHPGFQAKQISKQVKTEVAEKLLSEIFGESLNKVTI